MLVNSLFSVCKHCNQTINGHCDSLVSHSKSCTFASRPDIIMYKFVCYNCDYHAHTSDRMRNHIRIHIGEKPYNCKYCNYSCVQSSAMKIHLRIHSGEKPFKCSQCDYSCSQSNNLRCHMKSKNHY